MLRKIVGLIVVGVLLLSIFVGCGFGDDKVAPNPQGVSFLTTFPAQSGVSTDDGYFFTDEHAMLHFYDYKTEKTVFVCDKPDCAHKPGRTADVYICNAELPSPFFAIYNNAVYYFDCVNYNNSQLRRRAIDGNSDKLVAEYDGYGIIGKAMFYQNAVFFVKQVSASETFNPETGEEEPPEVSFCVIDFESEKETVISSTHSPYDIAFCVYEGKDGKVSYYDDGLSSYCSYDISTGKVANVIPGENPLLKEISFVYQGYAYFLEGGKSNCTFNRIPIEGGKAETIYTSQDGEKLNASCSNNGVVFMSVVDKEWKADSNRLYLYNTTDGNLEEIKNPIIRTPVFGHPVYATEKDVFFSLMVDRQDKQFAYAGSYDLIHFSIKDLKNGTDHYNMVYHLIQDNDTATFSTEGEAER